ncbi:MAG: helix-turn-helix domain-containing protein [Eubacteriales bacterium]
MTWQTACTVSAWECGKANPDVETLTRLASIFDVDINLLIYGEKKEPAPIIQQIVEHKTVNKTVSKGLSFGAALAMIISHAAWGSIPWAIFHGILGWVYVLYYIIKY